MRQTRSSKSIHKRQAARLQDRCHRPLLLSQHFSNVSRLMFLACMSLQCCDLLRVFRCQLGFDALNYCYLSFAKVLKMPTRSHHHLPMLCLSCHQHRTMDASTSEQIRCKDKENMALERQDQADCSCRHGFDTYCTGCLIMAAWWCFAEVRMPWSDG